MTPSDDILDLLGRYATGSLTEEERKRLFAAALDDQELFEQLIHEQDIKQLLEEPGARDRMIHALKPPRRKTAWIFGIAATAAFSVVLMVVLLRPAPNPPQVAENKVAPVQTESAPAPVAQPEPAPVPKTKVVENRRALPADEPGKDAVKKESEPARDAVALASPAPAAPPPVVAPRAAGAGGARRPASSSQAVEVQAAEQAQVTQQQNQVASGPKQIGGVVGRLVAPTATTDEKVGSFGFHYSTDIQGHLSIIPAVDGYLFAKSNDGKVLFGPKLSAAGIIVDLPLADGVTSVTVMFSETADPVQTRPAQRTEISGTVDGGKALAVEIKVK